MAGVNPEAGGWKAYPSAAVDSVDGRSSDHMEVHNTLNDDGSVMHFSATRPVAVLSSGQNKVIPSPTQFSILYKGNMCIYEGIPAEKVREIMLIASTSAKSAEMKSGIPLTSLFPTSPSSPQGNSTNLASPQSVCFPAKKSSICRLQEFPIARRQSLQRFLEKRGKRLGNKAPYAFLATKAVNNIDHNFCAEKTPDFGSLNYHRQGFQPRVAASLRQLVLVLLYVKWYFLE
ncbi:TIFY 3B [Spatholobus suberectus]|nr:TIFY 3B [Spatholobus suberectus]